MQHKGFHFIVYLSLKKYLAKKIEGGTEYGYLVEMESRLNKSSSSLPSPIIKEATLINDANKSQPDLSKKCKTDTTAKIDESNLQSKEAVHEGPGTETETETGSSVLLHPNSSVSAEESVFCIDHILESILGDCDRQTLLNCRLVCRRWAYYGSKSLQNIVTLAFTHKFDYNRDKMIGFQFQSNPEYSIEDLTTLMSNSTEFPSNSFTFSNSGGDRCSYTPEPFLHAFGHAIKKVEFKGILSFHQLKQLLLTQTPNLEQLCLSSISIFDLPHIDSIGNTQTPQERARLMKTRFTDSKNVVILKYLKIFESSSNIPKMFTQQILEASPNLVQVSLPAEYLDILVKPINRLHLLKKLKIEIDDDNIESFESVAHYHEDNLALEELEFVRFDSSGDDADNMCDRVMDVTAKILKASRASCKRLTWHQFLRRVEMPDMPQVKHLTLRYFTDQDDEGLPLKVLPEGVSIGDSFPNLKSLEMMGSGKRLTLEKYFGTDSLVPVEGVPSVHWNIFPDGDVTKSVEQSLRKMFPNATIRIASLEDFLGSDFRKNESDYDPDYKFFASFANDCESSSDDESSLEDGWYYL